MNSASAKTDRFDLLAGSQPTSHPGNGGALNEVSGKKDKALAVEAPVELGD